MVPPPDQRDLELAYLRGHVAGLDHRSKNPAPPRAPRSRHLKRDTTPLLTWSAGRRRRLRQRRHKRPNPERTAVPWRPLRRRNDPRNLPSADPPPPGGDPEGATGAATMIVPVETTVQLIAGPTAPRRGMTSHDRRDVPPVAR